MAGHQEENEVEMGDERDQSWEDWQDGDEDVEQGLPKCLFCDLKFTTCGELFKHCGVYHLFDFEVIRKELGLGFYECFKLINYIRSQVARHICWNCSLPLRSHQNLLNHLHKIDDLKRIRHFWDDDKYLRPFMVDDSLLYSFDTIEDGENDSAPTECQNHVVGSAVSENFPVEDEVSHSLRNFSACIGDKFQNGNSSVEESEQSNAKNGEEISHSLLNRSAKHVRKVNADYFESYSSFGIHKDMLSDKVRMDAYKKAILGNPSLFRGAVVMDVGCGTGILSLFSAVTGASRVLAVEASEKMASVASQIANDNGYLRVNSSVEANGNHLQVIEVVQGMIEELDKTLNLEANSVDILLSEWMGYCLLYESMLSSVLVARDKWLKPGGAILPDIATMYVAGFGKENTCLPFWENVHGFNMSSVGKETLDNAAKFPIVDLVDKNHLVTNPEVLKTFDLTTMKSEDVDFTATVEIRPSSRFSPSKTELTWCYGVVLWFDTSFTNRFCQESPAVLSTAPQSEKTHWSQTVLTFREPIAMAGVCKSDEKAGLIGSDRLPAASLHLRISIVRAAQHRSIDISLEVSALSSQGQRSARPAQMFNLS